MPARGLAELAEWAAGMRMRCAGMLRMLRTSSHVRRHLAEALLLQTRRMKLVRSSCGRMCCVHRVGGCVLALARDYLRIGQMLATAVVRLQHSAALHAISTRGLQ